MNEGSFSRIENHTELCATVIQDPEQAPLLLDYLLNSPGEFQRLIIDLYDITTAVTLIPQWEEPLIYKIINTPGELERLTPNCAHFLTFARIPPLQQKYIDLLIDKVLGTPEKFPKLITGSRDVHMIAEEHPQKAARCLDIIRELGKTNKRFSSDYDSQLRSLEAKGSALHYQRNRFFSRPPETESKVDEKTSCCAVQ